ncbi:laminin subunit alpha [Acrasis kona]|uniref:Laminin subunit alpha n=1 Tax=Acrasis kona TaxID=1008807 RepID=A0AAW2YYT3_9EUKA
MRYITAKLLVFITTLIAYAACQNDYPLGIRSSFSDGTNLYFVYSSTIYKYDLRTLNPKSTVALSVTKSYAPINAIFNPTDNNIVYLYSAGGLDRVDLTSGQVTTLVTPAAGAWINGVSNDTSHLYVATYDGTTQTVSKYSSTNSVVASSSFSSSGPSVLGVSMDTFYVALPSSTTTTILKRLRTSDLTSLSDATLQSSNAVSGNSQLFILPDGIALFDNANKVASKYNFNANGSPVLSGSATITNAFQQVLQDSVNPYLFTPGLVYNNQINRGSANDLVYQTIDLKTLTSGTPTTIANTRVSYVRSNNKFTTNGAYSIGLSNGVVFWTILENNVFTTINNYIVSTGASKSYSSACWTCSPGFVHWYDAGVTNAPGGDRCACVPVSAPTTSAAPSTGAPCWTCPSGLVHWFDADSGYKYPLGGDRCACVSPLPPCWTCAPGWVSWFDLGYSSPPNNDRCQCIKQSRSLARTVVSIKK